MMRVETAEREHLYDLQYRLSYGEAYEAFYLLADKWGRKWRLFAFLFLGTVAAALLILQLATRGAVQYSLLVVFCALLMPFVYFRPAVVARRGAQTVVKQCGSYCYSISSEKGFILNDGSVVRFQADADARALESGDIFVVRPDKTHTFCIPKRTLLAREISGLRSVLSREIKNTRLLREETPSLVQEAVVRS